MSPSGHRTTCQRFWRKAGNDPAPFSKTFTKNCPQTEEELGALLINLSRTHKNRAMDLKLLIVLGIFHRFFWTPEFSMSWDILEDHFSFSRCIVPIFAEQENENFCGAIFIWFPSAPSSRILWTRPSDPRTWNIFDCKTLCGEGTRKTCIFQQKQQEKQTKLKKLSRQILLKILSQRKQFGKSWTYLNSSLKRTIRVCYIINASWICRVEKICPQITTFRLLCLKTNRTGQQRYLKGGSNIINYDDSLLISYLSIW